MQNQWTLKRKDESSRRNVDEEDTFEPFLHKLTKIKWFQKLISAGYLNINC